MLYPAKDQSILLSIFFENKGSSLYPGTIKLIHFSGLNAPQNSLFEIAIRRVTSLISNVTPLIDESNVLPHAGNIETSKCTYLLETIKLNLAITTGLVHLFGSTKLRAKRTWCVSRSSLNIESHQLGAISHPLPFVNWLPV